MLPTYLTEFHKLPDPPRKTVNRMMQAALQQQQINPVSLPMLERLPLATEVRLLGGTEAVICDHNPNDHRRYQVAWFDRHFWTVRRKWVSREDFIVVEKQTAEAVASAVA